VARVEEEEEEIHVGCVVGCALVHFLSCSLITLQMRINMYIHEIIMNERERGVV
jgi:hypothetical protein